MSTRLSAAGAALLAIGAVGLAIAAIQQPSAQGGFTVERAGASAGLHDLHLVRDAENPDSQPRAALRTDVHHWPAGARYDSRAAPACRASDLKLQRLRGRACPRGSLVGGGSAEARTGFAAADPIPARVEVYNAPRGAILLVIPAVGPAFALRPRYDREENTFTTRIPPLCVGFGTKPQGSPCDVGEAVVTRVEIRSRPRSRRIRGRRHTLIKTPPTCPESGAWTIRTVSTFSDGTELTDESVTPCRQ
jgi:hypothetical protein